MRHLKIAMPNGRLLTSSTPLAGYESDALRYKRFRPALVAIPASVDGVGNSSGQVVAKWWSSGGLATDC